SIHTKIVKARITVKKAQEVLSYLDIDDRREYVIGRDQTADLPLADEKISRRHAILRFDDKSKMFEIRDLDSLNGCHLNGGRIQASSSLQSGDEIRIGDFFLIFENEELEKNQAEDKLETSSQSIEWLSEKNMKTTGQLLQGKIEELGLADVLQMLAGMKKSGSLVLSNKKILTAYSDLDSSEIDQIFLKNGEIINAHHRHLDGEEALFEILELNQGYFALYLIENEKMNEVKIKAPIQFLLLEFARRSDEKQKEKIRLEDTDIFEALPHDDLKNLDRESLEVLQLVWKLKNWKSIKSAYKKSEDKLEEVTRRLIQKSFLKKVN
ncbi:MAG: FHA domain-containing protein, partial [Bdellovibrionota bacterium]